MTKTIAATKDDIALASAALTRGDARAARDFLLAALAAGRADTKVLLGLARAQGKLGEYPEMLVAIDRVLALEPRNTEALILKADYFVAAGNHRAASAFYLAAVRSAPPQEQMPVELLAEVRRAQTLCEQYAAQYQVYLVDQLTAKGFDPAKSSSRFAQSLDIVLGKKKIYLQEPRFYYFPALPQIQFYDRAAFPWLDAIEQATPTIRAELLSVLNDPNAFAPYVQGDPNRPRKEQAGMLNNPDWSAFYLWQNGKLVEANAERCPNTIRALRNVPLSSVPNRSPSVLFSLLKAGTRIPPHNGFVNTRLICHLPLIVPGRCHFRVGNDVREWQEGKAWVFDDTIEHEAWNDSDQTRVILLFEIWRPELTEEERQLVTSLFGAIDAHGGGKAEWSI